MPRHKSLFTVTNYKKFLKLDKKTQAKKLLVLSLFFIPLSLAGIIWIATAKDEIYNVFLLYAVPWLIIGVIMFFSSIFRFSDIKEEEREIEEYNLKLVKSNISEIDKFNGKEFESFCKLLYEKMGYEVSTTKSSGDYGVDLILNKNGIQTIGQCKRYSDKVSISAVQEIVAAKNYYNTYNSFIITNNYFTKPAITLAEANSVELIDRKKLVELICKVKGEKGNFDKELLSLPKKEAKQPIKNTNYVTITNEHNNFSKFVQITQDEIVGAYTKSNFELVKQLVLKVEEEAKNRTSFDDNVTLHFFYQNIANILYAMRHITEKAIEDCIKMCDKDIELLEKFDFAKNATITSITRKAIILEKQNKIEEAINLCELAIKKDYFDNGKPFTIRKARLLKKINNKGESA